MITVNSIAKTGTGKISYYCFPMLFLLQPCENKNIREGRELTILKGLKPRWTCACTFLSGRMIKNDVEETAFSMCKVSFIDNDEATILQ